MQLRIEKTGPKSEAKDPTPNSDALNTPKLTAKMHFYAVRNAGDQLRWIPAPRTSKKPDRMVGR